MKNILYSILLILLAGACSKVDEYLPPDFNYPIPQVDIKENVNVGAYYYQYAQTDWDKNYTNTPTLGEYSALDPSVMTQHRIWADQGGIDYLIFKWDGVTNDALLNSFITDRTQNVRMVIDYNTAHLGATNASPLIGIKLSTMINELKTFVTNHFGNDYYFKTGNKPVIIISPVNLSSSAASSIDYTTVIPAIRTELSSIGADPFIIGEITSGWLPPQRYSAALKVFDAVVLSDWKADGNYGYDRACFFPAFSDQAFNNWVDSTSVWGIDFVPCIMPGYDDKTMSPSSKIYNLERSDSFYTDMCNVAKRNLAESRLVMINSWNNFQYGTTIEPTEEYGSDYLTVTKSQFKINK